MKPVILAAGTGIVVAGVTAVVILYGVPALRQQPPAPAAPAVAVAPPVASNPPPAPVIVRRSYVARPAVHHYQERPVARYVPPPVYTPPAPPAYAPPPPPPVCSACGVVESVRQERVDAAPTGGGAILGGIAGAVLGHQMGGGRGRDLATVAGAAGGAFLGNRVEETARGHYVYDVTVRRDNGLISVLKQSTFVAAGQKVRIEGDQAVPE